MVMLSAKRCRLVDREALGKKHLFSLLSPLPPAGLCSVQFEQRANLSAHA